MKVHVAERDIYRTLEERKQERTSRQYALASNPFNRHLILCHLYLYILHQSYIPQPSPSQHIICQSDIKVQFLDETIFHSIIYILLYIIHSLSLLHVQSHYPTQYFSLDSSFSFVTTTYYNYHNPN